jgi:cell surface protein SprA
MLNVPLSVFTAIKKARNLAKASGTAWYNREFSVYDTNSPKNRISIMGNPTLGEVKTMIIGVRNLSDDLRSGEIWVNELRLKEFNNDGGWAAQGQLNIQMSDFGNVLVTGKMVSEGFGGLEDGVNQRSKDNVSSYSVKTNLELGKFFPDKAKVSIPLYYSISKERSAPKYNPLDNDMLLKEALDAAGSKHARDSIENIAVTKRTNTNFSLSNMKVGITTKGHPMPYDPGNFTFSYSHSHSNTTGETTVYENDDEWRGSINYSYSPVYKPWEPFKKVFAKNKSKWLEILKRFGLNWLPQNISFNTEMYRIYHEQQERDMEDLNTSMPATFSSEFRWNREFSMRWDLTKNLHMSFQSATHAQIEEPYTQVNKDLYPDRYEAWKDSVWTSIKHMGTPLDYNQVFTASYQLPLNLIPIFDWVNSDANYNATYKWTRGTEMENGESLGNIVSNNRQFTINGSFNLEKLYNHFPFLKKANERFNKNARRTPKTDKNKNKNKNKKDDKNKQKEEKELPKNKKSFEKEITLMPDTTIIVNHGKNSKRLMVSAKGPDGKLFPVKYKYVDQNKIKITTKVDSATTLKLTVTPKPSNEEQSWYKTMQVVARGLMMVRNVSFTYRNQYAMALPGFKPTVGDMFGQQQGNPLAPGLDFAFGFIDDGYIDKALDHKWLMTADDLATPATTNKTVDLQLRMTLEPVKNLKIDLNASRTETKAKSIQYMYAGKPTTQSGSFNMTTISIGTAFESLGDANSGYPSKAFDNFCNSLDGFRDRVEAQYNGSTYPAGSPQAGQKFDPKNGTVSKYSADVMIPAFLSSYTSMSSSSLDIFPTLSRLLPNWTIKYSGLSQLPWFRDVFKSVNLNHSYKSVYAVGSYSSYSTWMEYMNDLGFIKDATTGNSTPSSMYNVSTVSINEAFSPLLGVDFTFNNNLTCKVEYRKIRTLTLSTTSIQINEDRSNDWVFGVGYKITNFNPFASKARKVKNSKKKGDEEENAKKNAQKNNTSGFNSDLNLRLDISLRNQASVCRDIATRISSASNGNKALKLSFAADYTLTKMLTMSFFFNRQTNTPLLSASSYPTTTTDFGLSVKFSLTR